MNLQPRILGATLGAVAALAVGGVGLAWAQEAPTTPSTEAPSTDAPATDEAPATDDGPAADRDDCPDKGDGGRPGATGTGTRTTVTDQISL
ncbi:MAG TPA: hypothetical protein VM242_03185 [Acidimicrobiales bacterium]|jgi:hypothetical protein|nr:hypothetical protein [Acidimicrobiales bacterium]